MTNDGNCRPWQNGRQQVPSNLIEATAGNITGATAHGDVLTQLRASSHRASVIMAAEFNSISDRCANFFIAQVAAVPGSSGGRYIARLAAERRESTGIRLCQGGAGESAACNRTPLARRNIPTDQQAHPSIHITLNATDEYPSCNRNATQKIYQVLLMTRFLANGRGGWAQIHASQANWAPSTSSRSNPHITFSPAGDEILVCKDGFKPNTEGTDCMPHDPAACGFESISRANMQYGPAGRPGASVSDQCWFKLNDEEYRKCVFGR